MRIAQLALVCTASVFGALVFASGCALEEPDALTNADDPLATEDELKKLCKGKGRLACDAGPDAPAAADATPPPPPDAGTEDAAAPPPPPPPPPPATCTSFTYSAYGPCQPNNTQTRTVISSSPAGCTGGTPVLTQACTYTPPGVSFATQVQPIFTASCASCHDGGLSPDLSAGQAHASLVNVNATFCAAAKYVVPGQPTQSWLVAKMTAGSAIGTCTGGSMARYVNSAADLDTITKWIQQGAPNN